VSIPAAAELVATGAAAQAAAVLRGETPQASAERWQKDAGTTLSSMPRDAETAERHRSVRQMALDAIAVSRPRA
jgi:xylulokinase